MTDVIKVAALFGSIDCLLVLKDMHRLKGDIAKAVYALLIRYKKAVGRSVGGVLEKGIKGGRFIL